MRNSASLPVVWRNPRLYRRESHILDKLDAAFQAKFARTDKAKRKITISEGLLVQSSGVLWLLKKLYSSGPCFRPLRPKKSLDVEHETARLRRLISTGLSNRPVRCYCIPHVSADLW